jgi:hypothetical protein
MKLKQRKVIVQAGTRPPFKFYLSDPFFAAVVGAQQSNTIVPTLVAQLRGRGLESLLNPMLPAILKEHGLGHLVRPRLALFPLLSSSFPHHVLCQEQQSAFGQYEVDHLFSKGREYAFISDKHSADKHDEKIFKNINKRSHPGAKITLFAASPAFTTTVARYEGTRYEGTRYEGTRYEGILADPRESRTHRQLHGRVEPEDRACAGISAFRQVRAC